MVSHVDATTPHDPRGKPPDSRIRAVSRVSGTLQEPLAAAGLVPFTAAARAAVCEAELVPLDETGLRVAGRDQ